jgi:hypothetical protein
VIETGSRSTTLPPSSRRTRQPPAAIARNSQGEVGIDSGVNHAAQLVVHTATVPAPDARPTIAGRGDATKTPAAALPSALPSHRIGPVPRRPEMSFAGTLGWAGLDSNQRPWD